MRFNDAERMVIAEWEIPPEGFLNVELDAFVVMPNHVHGITVITNATPGGAGLVPAHDGVPGDDRAPDEDGQPQGLPLRWRMWLARSNRASAFNNIRGVKTVGCPPFRGRLWQRNYYEHVVCNENSLNRIRQYILANPARWSYDRENPRGHCG